MVIGCDRRSCTLKDFFTWNLGLSTAHCMAQPLATHSSLLRRRPGSRPNTLLMVAWMRGMRTVPPICSTASRSSAWMPAWARAPRSGASTRSSRSSDISSKVVRSIISATSTSFMRQGTFSGDLGFALSTFLTFSHAASSRTRARAFSLTSILYFRLISSVKCFARRWSKLRPPMPSSYVVARTFMLCLLKETISHCSDECPMSTNATRYSPVSGRSFW
mmetsp:Transcript_24357/g.68283  ORF Transcript_24357/g.68283 Transcript_24357/m.68283 type:complete len:219 (+) Transcript_24357:1004-1660(+)